MRRAVDTAFPANIVARTAAFRTVLLLGKCLEEKELLPQGFFATFQNELADVVRDIRAVLTPCRGGVLDDCLEVAGKFADKRLSPF